MIFIHSPFVPISQFEVNFIKPKVDYIINIKMEEEHLLPHPYQTNCTDYDALWLKNNRTGPRSENSSNSTTTPLKKSLTYMATENMKTSWKIKATRKVASQSSTGMIATRSSNQMYNS
ncbi:hypothetical protein CEXT_689551 [Caerostris extrusa]|uniref:Uncharacterized protein n=1 Tax=Caerostris extrusa TaxID=172846 RepID=A0AAV4VPR4_CAEEX|nr:hypothetical protein CEXT_689551 [Caerostris extrusa]